VSTKVFIDTLFVVALINQRDAYHQKATQLADLNGNWWAIDS